MIYLSILFITIGYTILESINISVFFPLFKSILGQEKTTGWMFLYLEKIIASLPVGDPFIGACILAVTILIVKEIFGFIRQTTIAYGVGKVVCDAKERIFSKYINSDYQFFLENKQGGLIYNIILAPGKLGNCLNYIPDMITAILMTVTIGTLLMSISVYVTLFLIIVGLAFNFLTHLLASRVSYHIGTERAVVSMETNVVVNEFIDGIKHIKVFGSFESWLNNFTSSVRRFKNLVIKDAIWLAIPERFVQMILPVIMISIALFLRYLNTSPEFLLSNLAAIGIYTYAFYRLIPYLTSFGRLRMQIMGALPDVEILYNILNQKTNNIKDGNISVNSFTKEIKFENVSFSYKGKKDILKDINISIEKGKITAIVGTSGAGKSTLVNLILKLFKSDKGRITIDGIDINEIKYSSLANLIGVVSQETFIFNASIKDNILFGLKGILFDKIVEATRLANAHEFIVGFPNGYETIVGDKGLKLSGGQRQRIAIARAILRCPQILIMDEATSSLDYYSEALVQQSINAVSKNRTVIVIAHRLSTIINADKIVVLHKERVHEEGSHNELIKQNGIYKTLYDNQGKMFLNQDVENILIVQDNQIIQEGGIK